MMWCVHARIVILLSLMSSESQCKADDQRPTSDSTVLKELFQNALMNDSEQLFVLQRVFLAPSREYPAAGSLCIYANITVGEIIDANRFNHTRQFNPWPASAVDTPGFLCDGNKNCTLYDFEGFEILPPDNQVTTTLTSFLQAKEITQTFRILDGFYYALMSSLSNEYPQYYYDTHYYNVHQDPVIYYYINIAINQIEDMPSLAAVTDALSVTLSWAKGYAKTDGKQLPVYLEDISMMKTGCNHDSESYYIISFTPEFASILIFITYFLLTILIPILIMLYSGKLFTALLQKKGVYLKNTYNATAFVLTLVNIGDFSVRVVMLSFDHDIRLIIKLLLLLLIYTLEVAVFSFNVCKYHHKKLHAYVLLQITLFVHKLVADAIISILMFAIAPAQVIGVITLVLSIILSLIIFMAHLFTKLKGCCNCSKTICCSFVCCTLLTAIIVIALVITLTLLFITLVNNGLKSAGIGGLILSIIPPTIVFVIGLFINRDSAFKLFSSMLDNTSRATNKDGSADGNANDVCAPQPKENQIEVAITIPDDELTNLIQKD